MKPDKKLGNPALLLRLPESVGAKLAKDAKKAKTTVQAVVLGILADHYRIEVAAPRRGKPKSAAEPEMSVGNPEFRKQKKGVL